MDILHPPMQFVVSPSSPPTPSSSQLVCSSKTTYEILSVINRGSYGVVYKACDQTTGQILAVKQELTGQSSSTKREIDILVSLPTHPSIVQLIDHTTDSHRRVFIVMEYVEKDMKKLMEESCSFTLSDVKFFMKRILEGVAFIHENGVMHRDLKPSNILVNSMDGKLKICDFGLSRGFDPKEESGRYTPRVGSLWYKAPEVLLGMKEYSCAVDMWSVGCIMAELLLKQVLFKGSSEIGQLISMYTVLGMPNDDSFPGFSSLPGSRLFLQMVKHPRNLLRVKFADAMTASPPMLTECGFDLLRSFLNYDPKQRITARDALNHGWFREYFGIRID